MKKKPEYEIFPCIRPINRSTVITCGLCFSILVLLSCNTSSNEFVFQHHVVADPLPGDSWGTGGFTLADFDNDGDLDVTVQRRSDDFKVYWYEYRSAGEWIQHYIGIAEDGQLGAAAVDVNRNGFIDLVLGHVWFQNPGNLGTNPGAEWIKHYYNGDMPRENHDIVVADINQDGIDDIVMYNQSQSTLRWYDITDPYDWKYTDIATDVNDDYVHSGMFPNGVVDIDNDGFPDVIMPIYWYKNPGKSGEKWIKVEWPYIPIDPTPYGKGIRVWAGDINNNGLNDIIYSDCDVQHSRLYILFNEGGGKSWKMEEIPLPPSNVGESGSLHSLQVADFNNNGLLDIFVGEQEDPNKLMKPPGLKERGIIFQNVGTVRNPKFSPIIINEDNPGWHDALIGDVDGDGDIDIVSKIWNKDGVNYHLDFWENKLK
jgi:hypothetical protein